MSDVIYIYDGTFEGVLCCIFDSYERKEIPVDIVSEANFQPTFYSWVNIDTDVFKANRVKTGIRKQIGRPAFELILDGYYTCHPKKELLILKFVRLGMKKGGAVMSMLTDETVCELQKAVYARSHESHQLKGFVRFSIYNNFMVSIIEPKNFVLPEIAPHFCDRYANEAFMIYDKTHKAALIYQKGSYNIVPIADYEEPSADDEEMMFRSLWKLFHKTISIDERENPRCQMSHMQKRYWGHLTEMEPDTPLLKM